MVGTLNGLVVTATNFIMMAGPMAHTRAMSVRASSSSLSGSVTSALRPHEPSSVVDDDLVRERAHSIFPEQEVLAASADDGDDLVAGFVEGADDGEHGGDAHAAADANHRAEVFDLGGMAQRPDDRREFVAHFQGPSA